MDHHLLLERADEEVILILGANLAGVGKAVDVDLVVPGLRSGVKGGAGAAVVFTAGIGTSFSAEGAPQSVARRAERPVRAETFRGASSHAKMGRLILPPEIVMSCCLIQYELTPDSGVPHVWLQPHEDRTGPAPAPGATILIVDDEAWVRRLIARMVRDAGYSVMEAGSADEAIGLLESRSEVRVVLTDVVMPGMDGVQLAGRIRERFPNQHVLLMSAFSDVLSRSGHPGSRLPLLSKPFTATQLTQKIKEALEPGH